MSDIFLSESFEKTSLNFPDFDLKKFKEALKDTLPVSVRLNPAKASDPQDCFEQYDGLVPWCDWGFYLQKRPYFTHDPLIHAGAYYVQEASSMFLEQCFKHVNKQIEIRTALDLCAAPGGKTTHLASLMQGNGLLVSNEVIRPRAGILCENVNKWGMPNVVVTSNDPENFENLTNFFDFIWVDAPCSGEGMFRKEAKAVTEWSVDNVNHCAARQERILKHAWEALQPGGFLAYSTCTYNTTENEGVIKKIIDSTEACCVEIPCNENWNVTVTDINGVRAHRFYPYKTRGEGFCAILLHKPDSETRNIRLKRFKLNEYRGSLAGMLKGNNYNFVMKDSSVYAINSNYRAEIEHLFNYLYVMMPGINVAEIKRDAVPSADLALSTALNKDAFVTYDTDLQTAISFLKKDTIILPQIDKGYVLITYKHFALGWVKNLGNRCNNMLPTGRRILK